MDAAPKTRGARAAKAPARQPLEYLSGFGNEFATEALPGALPIGRNSPQRCAYGLYAEQISSTAFTALRGANRRTWTYRIRPAAMHEPFKRISDGKLVGRPDDAEVPPTQMRWSPMPLPKKATDFVSGLFTMAHAGDPVSLAGGSIHMYAANRSMKNRFFYDADGELLIVPQSGRLHLFTEMGQLMVEPQEIAVVPRGVRFRVELPDVKDEGGALEGVRGYICENYGASFRLPDLGPIGSNGLANPRDFLAPVAWYEDVTGSFELVAKFQGRMWSAKIGHSPLDVVAWHGNSTPYKYDLRRFNTIGSISYDHPDPSIFLVLQSQSAVPGVDAIDFVIFPPRWLAGEDTFRPPWFHRNIASEFMGLVHGQYDAKAEGFAPGGASLHSCMTGHGPDQPTFAKASAIDTSRPAKVDDTMAFMFETPAMIVPTRQALALPTLQREYWRCWQGLTRNFDPSRR